MEVGALVSATSSTVAGTGTSLRSRAMFLTILLLFPLLMLSSAEPNESGDFSQSRSLNHFSTGFIEGNVNIGDSTSFDVRIDYPSTNGSGEMAEMAWDGAPFPMVVFFVDEGEESDNYGWITQSLASSGYIIVTPEARWDTDEVAVLLGEMRGLYSAFGNVNDSGFEDGNQPDNFIGGFDLDHWGVGGHGTGATLAATVQVAWDFQINNDTLAPPRALFGLGLDKADMPSLSSLMPQYPQPGYALFMTGTVDEIAPAHQNVKVMLEDWSGGWHLMEVRGADHLQYQDDSGFLEGLSDGDATISESEQQSHALEHISPYLDLILKGDHNDWRLASNREVDTTLPSDAISYLDEDLSGSRLLHVADARGPEDDVELGNVSSFSMLTMHRNGDFIAGNDTGFDFNCTVIGHESIWAVGSIDPSTARSSCELNLDQLAPGIYHVLMSSSLDGMPASLSVDVVRGNTGLNQTDPVPAIILDQHGSVLVSASAFATDPDGQPIHFQNATWMAVEGEKFSLDIAGENMTISHTSSPEWAGSTLLALTLIESNTENPDTMNLVTQVTVLAVDDQVVSLGQIPSQQMYEDGEPLVLDLGQWYYDPEGEPLVVSASSSDARLSVTVNHTNITLVSAVDWNGAAIVMLNVSDGTTAALSQSMPVQIIATYDEPKFNPAAWNLTFAEDETTIVDLTTLAWDPDGVEMSYIFSPDDSIGEFALLIEQGVLTIQPPANWNGEMELGWLNASDNGTTITYRLKVTITPVNDIPTAQWQTATWQSEMLVVEYSYLDVDSGENHSLRYRIDDAQWMTVASICGGVVDDIRQCSVMFNGSELAVGGHTIDLVVVDGEHELNPERQIFTVAGEQLPSGEDFSSVVTNPSTWIVIVGVLLAIFLAKMLFTSGRSGGLVGAVQKESVEEKVQHHKEVIDVDEVESPPPDSESGGLLARAQRLKGR